MISFVEAEQLWLPDIILTLDHLSIFEFYEFFYFSGTIFLNQILAGILADQVHHIPCKMTASSVIHSGRVRLHFLPQKNHWNGVRLHFLPQKNYPGRVRLHSLSKKTYPGEYDYTAWHKSYGRKQVTLITLGTQKLFMMNIW